MPHTAQPPATFLEIELNLTLRLDVYQRQSVFREQNTKSPAFLMNVSVVEETASELKEEAECKHFQNALRTAEMIMVAFGMQFGTLL